MALTNDFQMSSLLGDHLLTKVGGPKKPTGELMKDKELVLLYFSASWCPPCKAFSPILMDFYKAISEKGKMEIVYISSDKSLQEFEEYFKKMPWLSIPLEQGSAAIKSNLAEMFGVQGIPTLVILDAKTGELIGAEARDDVTRVGGNVAEAGELLHQWKSMARIPLSEAAQFYAPRQNFLMMLIMTILKNPVSIFGIFYFYIKWKEFTGNRPVDEDGVVPPVDVSDTEF